MVKTMDDDRGTVSGVALGLRCGVCNVILVQTVPICSNCNDMELRVPQWLRSRAARERVRKMLKAYETDDCLK